MLSHLTIDVNHVCCPSFLHNPVSAIIPGPFTLFSSFIRQYSPRARAHIPRIVLALCISDLIYTIDFIKKTTKLSYHKNRKTKSETKLLWFCFGFQIRNFKGCFASISLLIFVKRKRRKSTGKKMTRALPPNMVLPRCLHLFHVWRGS